MPSKPKKESKHQPLSTSTTMTRTFLQDGTNGTNNLKGKDDHQTENSSIATNVDAYYNVVVADLRRQGLFSLARDVAKSNPVGKRDPVSMLSDELCCEIFSYLCEKPETDVHYGKDMTKTTWLCSKTGPLNFQLSSVSPKWKSICDEIIPWSDWVGLLDLIYDSIHSDSAHSLVCWLIRHKIRLGRLRIQKSTSLEQTKDVELFTNLLKTCPTEDLLYLRCYAMHFKNYCLSSADNLGHQLKKLHDLIAQKCPNLKKVCLSLMLPKTTPIYSDYISSALFSISSIEILSLYVGFHEEEKPKVDPELKWGTKTPIDGMLFSRIIQNLPKLQMFLMFGEGPITDERGRKIRFHVASPTLKMLACDNGAPIIPVDCPALEELGYNAGPNGNNCMLNHISSQQFARARQNARRATAYYYEVNGFPPSPHLQVPNECKLVVKNIHKWGADDYEEFMGVVNANVTDSVYQTFEDDL